MSSNSTPVNRSILISVAKSIRAGQLTHGATVGLHHHTDVEMTAAILKNRGATPTPPQAARRTRGASSFTAMRWTPRATPRPRSAR